MEQLAQIVRLLRTELKRALQAFPQQILTTLMLLILLGIFVVCGVKLSPQAKIPKQIRIDLVSLEDPQITSHMLDLITKMDSTQGLIYFTVTSEEEAYLALEEGLSSAIMILPSELLSGIMDQTNPSIQVILPNASSLSTILLQELTSAGAKLLSSAQAGIYTIADLFLTQGLQQYLTESYRALDALNLRYVLARESLFNTVNTSVTGKLSPLTYYTASAILLLLFLFGITCSHVMQKDTESFYQQLHRCSLSAPIYILIKWMTVFVSLFMTVSLLFGIYCMFVPGMTGMAALNVVFSTDFGAFMLILLMVSIYIVLLYQIGNTTGTSILLLFITTIILMFLSGAFIPVAFFPQILRELSVILPTTYALRQLSNLCISEPSSSLNLGLFFYLLLFYIGSILLFWKRRRDTCR